MSLCLCYRRATFVTCVARLNETRDRGDRDGAVTGACQGMIYSELAP
jgi:hypothetical protein